MREIFIGRAVELSKLRAFLSKHTASLIAVKGRRRIGKSSLIERFAENKTFYSFTGLAPDKGITAQKQREEFARKLGEYFGIRGIKTDDWGDLFSLLASQIKGGRVIILFDEISWMSRGDPTFLSKLRNAWDEAFKNNQKMIFFLCSSVSSWIEKNVISSTGFFGRISLALTVDELSLNDSSKLLTARGFSGSNHEKFKILSVTGGVPWYIEQIHENDSANDFILRNCFSRGGVLVDDFNKIFHDLFHKRNTVYKKIVRLLVSGILDFNTLCEKLSYRKGGKISDYLYNLIEAGFVHRDYTWIIKTRTVSRLSNYRLSDNYLRFYLKYIESNLQKIEQNHFDDFSALSFPGWETIIGLQFENLVLKNRDCILSALNIKHEDIASDNPFFQRKTEATKGCQIDYLIQTKDNRLFACEVKFSNREITKSIVSYMQEKIGRLSMPRNFVCLPVLIHVGAVSNSVVDSGYFKKIIDFSEFLNDDS